ncbi:60S ribosomal protein L36 [Tupaia chinensis]|uniref:60S ribosomal protein L36 n=1 Tax=Tupaia chinensis TaxID=246437 RepID=L9JCY6_TUPCH|nr:60S ribosomal protein L36 [Tupaia chinensis]
MGLNKGHRVMETLSPHCGRLTKHVKLLAAVCGLTPARRALELPRVSKDKPPLSSSRSGWGHTSAPRGSRRRATSWLPHRERGQDEPSPVPMKPDFKKL